MAWACGDNQGHGTALNGCTNQNSISIEMCINSDGNFDKTLYHTIEFTKELLRVYPQAIVCRHYDVSKKSCQALMVGKLPVFQDNGRELPNNEHKNWDIVYIGNLGKDRQDTGREACKKFLGWKS